jgi:hypothetical protein
MKKKLNMEYLKVAVDPELKKKLRLLTAETGTTLSHLVSEILWQYMNMPQVKMPQVKIPERMMQKQLNPQMQKALTADEAEMRRKGRPSPMPH